MSRGEWAQHLHGEGDSHFGKTKGQGAVFKGEGGQKEVRLRREVLFQGRVKRKDGDTRLYGP